MRGLGSEVHAMGDGSQHCVARVRKFLAEQGGLSRFLLFDLGTVAISVADVVSDVVVLNQFYKSGQKAFFALSLTIMVVSSAVFTIMFLFLGIGRENRRDWNIHDVFKKWSSKNDGSSRTSILSLLYFLSFLILLPFGQTFPVVMWAMETFYPTGKSSGATAEELPLSFDATGIVNAEGEITSDGIHRELAAGRITQGQADELHQRNFKRQWAKNADPLREYLKRQVVKHAPFLAETIAESVPQSLAQLAALIIIGRTKVAWVSIVSIILSIVSILSKSYIVSLSMTRPIFKAKMLVICFDVVALFYIFATLFMGDMGEVHLIHMPLIGMRVGVWSYLWIWKFVLFSVWSYLCFLGYGINSVIDEWHSISRRTYSHTTKSDSKQALIFGALACVASSAMLWVPLMLVVEATNMAFLVWWLRKGEAPFAETDYPLYCKVLSLVNGPDSRTKLQSANVVFAREQIGLKGHANGYAYNRNRESMQQVVDACSMDGDMDMVALRTAMKKHHPHSTPAEYATARYRKFAEDPLSNRQALVSGGASAQLDSCSYRCKAAFVHGVVVATVGAFIVSSVYSLVYPPLTFAVLVAQHLQGKVDMMQGARGFATILFVALLAIFVWISTVGRSSVQAYTRVIWHLQPIKHHPNEVDTPIWHAYLWHKLELEYAKRSGRSIVDIREEVLGRCSGEASGTLAEAHCLQCLSAWSR
jgi:hypothetical protein